MISIQQQEETIFPHRGSRSDSYPNDPGKTPIKMFISSYDDPGTDGVTVILVLQQKDSFSPGILSITAVSGGKAKEVNTR
ncbi:hypothetical protein NQZ68_014576 [Dissostichus eleginoides]|nr:hypothetical protein NQZ68_014576 [Dissostichus eleginoides]